jgi:hypothetical protein
MQVTLTSFMSANLAALRSGIEEINKKYWGKSFAITDDLRQFIITTAPQQKALARLSQHDLFGASAPLKLISCSKQC